ncbi:hypothetical protein [Hyphomonas sp.]|uniref:DUF7832 domain-containing protein n=1 Tax=Hyphomonas sp. TaxID=87 RepID=UPI0025BB6344|nr:hypothetical protein [Hyphomonas sp.]
MKYDDAAWHYGGDFPKDLPPEAAATHIGMFVVWCWLNGMAGAGILEDTPDIKHRAALRTAGPGTLFLELCDGKFIEDDLNDEGNAFARDYYDHESIGYRHKYFTDLENLAPRSIASIYHLPDSWSTFDEVSKVLEKRFKSWRKSRETRK